MFSGVEDPEETGATFEENALIKAHHYARATGLIAQLGSRMGEEGSIQMFEQFTRNLQRNFADSEGPLSDKEDAQALRAVPLLASAGKAAFVNFFRRITGRP